MTLRRLIVGLIGWLLLLALSSLALRHAFAFCPVDEPNRRLVISDWQGGKRIARRLAAPKDTQQLSPTSTVDEIVAEAPVLGRSQFLFGASFRAVTDGVGVSLGDKTSVLTPDDLLQAGAYEYRYSLGRYTLVLGVDRDRVIAELSKDLKLEPSTLLQAGKFRRISLRRRKPAPEPPHELTPGELDRSILGAARYLVGALKSDGSYRYEVDAFSNQELPGYSWPRHAGATWFIAQVASYAHDPLLLRGAVAAARHMLESASMRCGGKRCIAEGSRASVGSSALGLLALLELVETEARPEFASAAFDMADFLRGQQRADGEFMHEYDVSANRSIDVQHAYFTGEAALALSRMHRFSKDPRDLDAARRALDFLVHRPVWTAAARYLWGSEHWTCQAMADLWDRAANHEALQFCLDWQIHNRSLMSRLEGSEGSISSNPYLAPRYASSASRTEAAVATLEAARRAKLPGASLAELEDGVRRTLRLLVNVQLMPDSGSTHLFAEPSALFGGFPGGSADYRIRIDYPQHTGGALLRYRKLLGVELREPAQHEPSGASGTGGR